MKVRTTALAGTVILASLFLFGSESPSYAMSGRGPTVCITHSITGDRTCTGTGWLLVGGSSWVCRWVSVNQGPKTYKCGWSSRR